MRRFDVNVDLLKKRAYICKNLIFGSGMSGPSAVPAAKSDFFVVVTATKDSGISETFCFMLSFCLNFDIKNQ